MRYFTAGESHGKQLDVIIDQVPYGIRLSEDDVNYDLKRRSKGYGRSSRQDKESNTCAITSGINNGKSTGNPIHITVTNLIEDKKAQSTKDIYPRPGHADLNGVIKYNFDDCFNVSERASARETAARVCAGVVAKNFLAELGAEVYAYVCSVGSAKIDEKPSLMKVDLPKQAAIALSKVMCPDEQVSQEIIEQIDRAKLAKDSLGGTFKVVSVGVLPGLGSYSQGYDRIESKICAAIMSIPSVKGAQIGDAQFLCQNVGSVVADHICFDEYSGDISRSSNNSGGIEGGITTGLPIVVGAYVKPVPSIKKPLRTINLETMEPEVYICEKRSDVCVVPSAACVAEAELAIILANEYMKKFGCDTIADIKQAVNSYKQRIKSLR